MWTSDPAALSDGLKGSDVADNFGWGYYNEDGNWVKEASPDYVPAEMLAALYASEDGAWRDGAKRYVVLFSDDYDDEHVLYVNLINEGRTLDQNGDGELDQSEWPRGEGSLDSVAREHLANGIRTFYTPDYIRNNSNSVDMSTRMTMVYWQSSEADSDGNFLPAYSVNTFSRSNNGHMWHVASGWFDANDRFGKLMVVAGPELVEVAENVYEVKRMPVLNQDLLLAQDGKDSSVYEVENYWWYVYIDGEKTYIMDANGNLADGIDQVYWTYGDAADVIKYRDGEEVLIAESSGKIVAITPESYNYDRVNVVRKSSADSGDGTGADPSDAGSTYTSPSLPNTGSMYAPSSLPNTGSVYADQAREPNEKLAETGDATSARASAALTFAGVAAILAARAAKESKRRDN